MHSGDGIFMPDRLADAKKQEHQFRMAVEAQWMDVAKRVYTELVVQAHQRAIHQAVSEDDPLGLKQAAELSGDADGDQEQKPIPFQVDLGGPLNVAFRSADLFCQFVVERAMRQRRAAQGQSQGGENQEGDGKR